MDKTWDEGVVKRIFDYMEDNDISQKNIAPQVKMDPSTISRIKNHKRAITLDEIGRFATALGLTQEYILGADDYTKPICDFITRLSSVKLSRNFLDDSDSVYDENGLFFSYDADYLCLTGPDSVFDFLKQVGELDHLKSTLNAKEYNTRLTQAKEKYMQEKNSSPETTYFLISREELTKIINANTEARMLADTLLGCEQRSQQPLKIRKK